MVEVVKSIAAVVATCSEFIAVVVIVIGAIQAITSAVIDGAYNIDLNHDGITDLTVHERELKQGYLP